MTGGLRRSTRRVRRRMRCLRRGHRYQLHEQPHGDVTMVVDQCVRCDHRIVRGIREPTPAR